MYHINLLFLFFSFTNLKKFTDLVIIMPMLILLECENSSDYVSTSQVLMMSIELFHLVANKAIAMQ